MQDVDVDPLFYYITPQQQKENKYSAWLDGHLFLKELKNSSQLCHVDQVHNRHQFRIVIIHRQTHATGAIDSFRVPSASVSKLIIMIDDRELYSELDDDARKLLQDYNSTETVLAS